MISGGQIYISTITQKEQDMKRQIRIMTREERNKGKLVTHYLTELWWIEKSVSGVSGARSEMWWKAQKTDRSCKKGEWLCNGH